MHRPPTVRVIVGTVGKLTSGWETFLENFEWRKRGDHGVHRVAVRIVSWPKPGKCRG